jgi:hypothetical protein
MLPRRGSITRIELQSEGQTQRSALVTLQLIDRGSDTARGFSSSHTSEAVRPLAPQPQFYLLSECPTEGRVGNGEQSQVVEFNPGSV